MRTYYSIVSRLVPFTSTSTQHQHNPHLCHTTSLDALKPHPRPNFSSLWSHLHPLCSSVWISFHYLDVTHSPRPFYTGTTDSGNHCGMIFFFALPHCLVERLDKVSQLCFQAGCRSLCLAPTSGSVHFQLTLTSPSTRHVLRVACLPTSSPTCTQNLNFFSLLPHIFSLLLPHQILTHFAGHMPSWRAFLPASLLLPFLLP